MELRALRYFVEAAREENMSRAAERLHITQPALSKQIKALEEELGKKLFNRHSFSISLTEEGRLLLGRADDLLRMASNIEKEFASLDDITGGELHFGLAESHLIRLLAREIREFRKRYPALSYHITSGDTEQVADRLSNGLLDFAVLAEPPDYRRYEALAFPEADVWGVVMPADDPLAGKSSLSADDLADRPLFGSGQGWQRYVRPWCGDKVRRMRLEGTFRLSFNGAMFVKEGLGYLLTFDKLVDTSEGSGLAFRPLAPRLETPLQLVWNRGRPLTPIAERFLAQVKESFGHRP